MVKIKETPKRIQKHLVELPFLTHSPPRSINREKEKAKVVTISLRAHEQIQKQVIELPTKLNESEDDRERLRKDLRRQRESAIDQYEFNREVRLRFAAEKRIRDLEQLNARQSAELYKLKRDLSDKPNSIDAETQWYIADYKTPDQIRHREGENRRRRERKRRARILGLVEKVQKFGPLPNAL